MYADQLEELIRKADCFEPLLDMVKRLAAGWNTEHLSEFGCGTDEENRPFPESNWKHRDAMPEVLAFLKKIDTEPLPDRTLTPDQLAIVKKWRQEMEPLSHRSDAQVLRDCQELDDLVPGYINRLMNRRPLPWEENKP